MFNKKIFRLVLIIVLAAIQLTALNAEQRKAKIVTDTRQRSGFKTNRNIFGGFMEYIHSYMNGPLGYSAQEIMNRGFDMDRPSYDAPSKLWNTYCSTNSSPSWDLVVGGYNYRGKYAQSITNYSDSGYVGVYQNVTMDDVTPYTFYIYAKGISLNPLKLKILDMENKNLYLDTALGYPKTYWTRFQIAINPMLSAGKVNLILYYEGKGNIQLDEASLMPDNNMYGMKRKYYDCIKAWTPTMIRYPGGCFADLPQSYWENATGPIDLRTSPNIDWASEYQRMDFGWDEFLRMCKDNGITPFPVLNLSSAKIEDNLSLLEYCQGDKDSYNGKKRINNGVSENPIKLKYLEIGNEQYGNWEYGYMPAIPMTQKYLTFYDAIKQYDSSLAPVYSGDFWSRNFFDTAISVAKEKLDIYGTHPLLGTGETKGQSVDTLFEWLTSASIHLDNFFINFRSWQKNAGFEGQVGTAATEWNVVYDHWWNKHPYLQSQIASSLTACMINSYIRNNNNIHFATRTFNSDLFIADYDYNGKRVIAPTPNYYALLMSTHNTGDYLLYPAITCEKYNTSQYRNSPGFDNIPYLDIAVTATSDSVYYSVVNRNSKDTIVSDLIIDNIKVQNYRKLELWNSNLLSRPTPNYPRLIEPSEKFIYGSDGKVAFMPHSYTILAVSLKDFGDGYKDDSKPELICYPNPFNDFLSLRLPGMPDKPVTVKVYNPIGSELLTKEIPPGDVIITLSMDELPAGICIIKVIRGSESYVYKASKQQ